MTTTEPNFAVTIPIMPYGNLRVSADTADQLADRIVAAKRAEIIGLVHEVVAIAAAADGLGATVVAAPAQTAPAGYAPQAAPQAPDAPAWDNWSSTPPAAPAPPQYAPPAPAQAPAGAWPDAPTCAHGPRIHRNGVAKSTGKPWSGWFCPTPKGTPNQCAPDFGN